MKFFALLLTLLLSMFSINTHAAKITSDELNLGRPGSSSDKVINLGPTRFIRSNETTGKLEFSNDGGTIVKEIGSGSGSGDGGGINLLSNSSFEDGSPPQDWTNSGGTFTQETFANPSSGDEKFARFVATGAGQYVESALVTVPDDFSFGMMADVRYSSGSAFDLVILDSTGSTVYTSESFQESIGFKAFPTLTFQTPSAGSQLKMRIVSTGAGTIDLNKAYLGSNKGFSNFATKSVVIEEKILSSNISGPLPELTFSNLEIGKTYTVNFQFKGVHTPQPTNNIEARISHDGNIISRLQCQSVSGSISTIRCSISASVTFVATATTLTFDEVGSQYAEGNGAKDATWAQLISYEDGSGVAFTPEQADFYYEGYVTNTVNPGLSTATGFTVLPSASFSLVNVQGTAQIPCAGQESVGLNCDSYPANEQLGISINLPVAGKYKVCNDSLVSLTAGDGSGGGSLQFSSKVVKTNNSDDTILEDTDVYGEAEVATSFVAGSDTNVTRVVNCNVFDVSSAGKNTFKVFYKTSNSGSGAAGSLRQTSSQGSKFTVELLHNNVARPVIQDMVDTSRKEGYTIDVCDMNSTPGTLINTDGVCDSWISSVTKTGTGTMRMFFSTPYKYLPFCFCDSEDSIGLCGTNNRALNQIDIINRRTSDFAFIDTTMRVTCIGKR